MASGRAEEVALEQYLPNPSHGSDVSAHGAGFFAASPGVKDVGS